MNQQTAWSGAQAGAVPARQRPSQIERTDGTRRLHRRLELLLVIVLAAAYLLWFAWPLFWSASANVRLVGTFNTDEQAHVMLLKEAIEDRFPRLGYIQYGYAYLNMGLVPLFLLSLVTEVSEQQMIVWLRFIPALFGVATVALTFYVARRFFGRLTAWLSVFFLSFAVLNFLRMSAMSHSDVPQVFFIVAGVYFCVLLAREGRLKWLLLASASAGLAFGCKYSGLFVLPIIGLYGILATLHLDTSQLRLKVGWVIGVARTLSALAGAVCLVLGLLIVPRISASYAGQEYFGVQLESFFGSLRILSTVAGAGLVLLAVLPLAWTFVRSRPKLIHLLGLGMVAAITFGVVFALSSPFNVFSVRSGFMRGFFYESLHSSFGHEFEAGGGRLEWFALLASPELLESLILGLAAVDLALTLFSATRRGWRQFLEPASVLWVWALYYLVFLVWRVKIRSHRALLPIVPFLLIAAAHTVGQLVQALQARLSKRLAAAVTIAGLLIIAGLVLPGSLERALAFRQASRTREQTSERVAVGYWLNERYPPGTRIVYDPYVYVPPVFADAYVTPWGGTLDMLESLQPQVVIVDHGTLVLFSDVEQAGSYARDAANFIAKYEYYAALRSQQHGYELVKDFGKIQVYERVAFSRHPLATVDGAIAAAQPEGSSAR